MLDENLTYLKELNGLLQSGEKNFYECNQHIESCLNQSIKLIVRPNFLVKALIKTLIKTLTILDRTNKREYFHRHFEQEPSVATKLVRNLAAVCK
jgi:hypothetical protein